MRSKISEAALHTSEEIAQKLDILYPKLRSASTSESEGGSQTTAKVSGWVYIDEIKTTFEKSERILDLASSHILFQVQRHAHPPSQLRV